jgi:hypothetical protein
MHGLDHSTTVGVQIAAQNDRHENADVSAPIDGLAGMGTLVPQPPSALTTWFEMTSTDRRSIRPEIVDEDT